MPSYLSYMRQMTVMDADDDNIEAWITVRGNHIPIKKGQSKEDAVKSFIEKKGGSGEKKAEPKSNKQVFYKNISGKQIGSPKGHTFIENEIMTEKEMAKRGFDPTDKRFERKELGKNDHHFFFGARFENEKPESKKGDSEEKVDNEKIKKAINKVGAAVNERKSDEATTIKNLTKEMGLNESEVKKLNDFFGTGEGKAKYPAEFETVRKNAKANPYLYDLRYTQKSKAKAYEEYKKDTEKKDATTKQSDSPLVNAVARSLNMSAENAEKEVKGAVQHIKDLIKAKDLRNGDVEETLQGLGIESDYAEEFMEWVSAPTKKKDTEKKESAGEQHATTRNIMTLFGKHYEDLYDGKTKSNRELVKEFDNKMANDPEFKKQVQAFVRERGDVLSSGREVQAYMMAYNTVKSKLEPAMKKLERAHGQTIAQLKETGKDISKLQQAMQHINYGFYEEQGKNMTPEQLVDYLQGEIDKSYGKKDYYSSRVQTRYPEAIKLVKEYIND